MKKTDEKKVEKIAVVHNAKGQAEKVVKFAPRKEAAATKIEAKKETATPPPPAPPYQGGEKGEVKTKTQPPAPSPVKPSTLVLRRDTFQKDVAVAVDYADRKGTMPILSHILLSNDGQGHCRVTATDLEATWTKLTNCKGVKFSCCVPAALMLKEIKALPVTEREVVLDFKDNTVSVNNRCKLFTLSADDFPVMPVVKKPVELQIDNFIAGLKKVSVAVGDNDTRYTLNGVFLDLEQNKVVATDGHRLHFEDIKVRGEKAVSPIIPKKAAALMIKYPMTEIPNLVRVKDKPKVGKPVGKAAEFKLDVFGCKVSINYKPDKHGTTLEMEGPINETGYRSNWIYSDEFKKGLAKHGSLEDYLQFLAEEMYLTHNRTVAITVGEGFMTYPAAGGEMLIKTIDGTYPEYNKIIPKKNPVKVRFEAAAFLQNMEGVMPVANESVTLRINSHLTIQSQNPDRGDYKWQIPCKTEGKDKAAFDIKFNARFIIDAIKAFASQEVLLELDQSLSPCLINRHAVVMPMRLQ